MLCSVLYVNMPLTVIVILIGKVKISVVMVAAIVVDVLVASCLSRRRSR